VLDFEKLDVYQRSIEFLTLAMEIADRTPVGHAHLADQLRRAAMSIPLNLAEGSGKTQPRDRRRFNTIARGSAMECGATLDVLRVVDRDRGEEIAKAKEVLTRVVAMLSRMCR
jgi:four helix bundle protein